VETQVFLIPHKSYPLMKHLNLFGGGYLGQVLGMLGGFYHKTNTSTKRKKHYQENNAFAQF
jgi:hypothetical protein